MREAGQRVQGLRRQKVRLSSGQGRIRPIGADLTTVRCKGRWLEVGVVDASRGTLLTADILGSAVSDDADAAGLEHQVCKAHVVRNTEEWVAKMRPLLAQDADGSLSRIGVTAEQAVADCEQLLEPPREAQKRLEQIHLRYRQASAPGVGEPMSLAYSLGRWNLWGRLTLYRRWRGKDGTNNACKRATGA